MFNHTSGTGAKRPAHFFLGILAGAAAVGAYTLSSDEYQSGDVRDHGGDHRDDGRARGGRRAVR